MRLKYKSSYWFVIIWEYIIVPKPKTEYMRTRDFVRQKDSMQCGVACLATVCRILGAQYSLEFLTGFCHATTEEGMNETINN